MIIQYTFVDSFICDRHCARRWGVTKLNKIWAEPWLGSLQCKQISNCGWWGPPPTSLSFQLSNRILIFLAAVASGKRPHIPASLAVRLDHVISSNRLLSSGHPNDGNFTLWGCWSTRIEGAWLSDDFVEPPARPNCGPLLQERVNPCVF